MVLKPRRCLKCDAEIITIGDALKPNFVQRYFELENKNKVCVAFCKSCEITINDFEEIQKAIEIDSKIINESHNKTVADLAMERQGQRCFICGLLITSEKFEVMSNGHIRHIACPMQPNVDDFNSNPGGAAREFNERNKRKNLKNV